uniref:Uncharacterized protein n=2 Tax=Lygus hesperus TaxID=30085 RepID=A0A0A9W9K4_LYGHE
MGLNTKYTNTKSIDKELRYILFHSPDLQDNFGVKKKLVKHIVKFNQMLEEDRCKNRKLQRRGSVTKDALVSRYLACMQRNSPHSYAASGVRGTCSSQVLTSPQESPRSNGRAHYDLLHDSPRSRKTVTFSSSTENISRNSSPPSVRRSKAQ